MAIVLTLVQIKQIRINIHKRNNTKKHSTNNTKHSINKYTYYQKTHTLQNPHTHTQPHITQPNIHSYGGLKRPTLLMEKVVLVSYE